MVMTAGLALSLGTTALAAPVGALKQLRAPTANSEPRAITNGSDGNVWSGDRPGDHIRHALQPRPGGDRRVAYGSVWFTQTTKGNIARINNAGVITEAKAVKGSEPFGITVAPNGDPWYTMMSANKVATLQLR